MRESMGSAWIFSICLTFIIIFTAYLAISLNYARAFRIKNNIVTYIEEHEGYDMDYNQELEQYLNDEGYTVTGRCENRIQVSGYEDDFELQACLNSTTTGECGVCIYRLKTGVREQGLCAQRSTYRVIAFFKFDIPVVRYLTSFQVGGESRYFYDFAGTQGC